MTDLNLSEQEKVVNDLIVQVMVEVEKLYGGAQPANWHTEGIPAIHVLQAFVQQHWAHRIAPSIWSNLSMVENSDA